MVEAGVGASSGEEFDAWVGDLDIEFDALGEVFGLELKEKLRNYYEAVLNEEMIKKIGGVKGKISRIFALRYSVEILIRSEICEREKEASRGRISKMEERKARAISQIVELAEKARFDIETEPIMMDTLAREVEEYRRLTDTAVIPVLAAGSYGVGRACAKLLTTSWDYSYLFGKTIGEVGAQIYRSTVEAARDLAKLVKRK